MGFGVWLCSRQRTPFSDATITVTMAVAVAIVIAIAQLRNLLNNSGELKLT